MSGLHGTWMPLQNACQVRTDSFCFRRTELKNRDNSRRIERQLEWQT